jgi:LmbE family N-acetylglucosaminyl deacetylase
MNPLLSENVLLLAERPADPARDAAAPIAALCQAGRPPFVVVLSDGDDPDPDARARQALRGLGLGEGRMLMFGIQGAVPSAGPVYDATVRALCFVAWRHDCNLLVAPEALTTLAWDVVRASGVGLACYAAGSVDLLAPPRPSAREVDSAAPSPGS